MRIKWLGYYSESIAGSLSGIILLIKLIPNRGTERVKNFPALVVFGVGEKSLSKKLIISKGKKFSEIRNEILDFFDDKSELAPKLDLLLGSYVYFRDLILYHVCP